MVGVGNICFLCILVFVLYYYREAISRVSEAAGLKTASKRKKVGLYIHSKCMHG